ncbi:MAG: sigma-70 family RNA polymerase sigma factor [Chloroflexi bacterium]|nr:sigma-70 family RNA polymerase sigma factor [Chloroflexota bacterium]
MEDTLLVSRAMAGDLDSFGQLYDRYFNRVYDFAWRILRDSDEAADVTQDVFMKAMQALPALSKAASFKSWLFTIAHHTAVSRAERAGRSVRMPSPVHEEAFGTFDVPDPCRIDNPAMAAEDHELAALVWEAASALNPRDYAVLDLHVRQGLDSAEIASVLQVSKGNAYTMVSRMKDAAADVIGSYVVARRGSKDCDALQRVLADFAFPPYTDEVRRAVDLHIKGCERCQGARRRLAAPLEIFGAFAAVPAPLALKGDAWRKIAGAWNVPAAEASMMASAAPGGPGAGVTEGAYGAAALAGAGGGIGLGGGFGGGDDGFGAGAYGMGGGGEWDRRRILWFVGAAAALLVFAFAVGAAMLMALGGNDEGGGGGAVATKTAGPTRTHTPVVSITPGVAVQTATPDLTPSITPTPADTETPEPETSTPIPAKPTNTPRPQTPTRTPTPGKATAVPSPTKTPKVTATATATKTPQQ